MRLFENIKQQVVQSEAWRLGIAENLLVMDSDCKLNHSFQASDFITPDGTPNSVLCGTQYVCELAARLHTPKIWTDWLEMSDRTRKWAHEDSVLVIRAISFLPFVYGEHPRQRACYISATASGVGRTEAPTWIASCKMKGKDGQSH